MSAEDLFDDPIIIVPDDLVFELPELAADPVADPVEDLSASQPEELALEDDLDSAALVAPRLWLCLGLVAAVCFVVFVVYGWTYYTLPVGERPFHVADRLLRASGRLGLSFGVAGTVLMVLNLTYLIRKRLLGLEWLGSLRGWMGFHVVTGLVGPALILLHSGFAPYSAVGTLAFVAMLVVVCAGLIGRFIYALVPRSVEGKELDLEEVRRRVLQHESRLVRIGIDPAALVVGSPETPVTERRPLYQTVARIVRGDRESRRRLQQVKQALRKAKVGPHCRDRKLVARVVREFFRERQWLVRYQELRHLMGVWRYLHRWLAVLMLLVVLFHVVLAVRFGSLWVLGGTG